MHNPFRRAARNGAPDMRITAPPSAETPMPAPSDWGSLESQLTEARRQNNAMNVEVAKLMGENDRLRHRINSASDLLHIVSRVAVLEDSAMTYDQWREEYVNILATARAAIAQGETE